MTVSVECVTSHKCPMVKREGGGLLKLKDFALK